MDIKNKDNAKSRTWSQWFEIPVESFDRAVKFYQDIFDVSLHVNDFGGFKMAVFPHGNVGAAICWGAWYKPGDTGPVVYMNANPDLSTVLERIEPAGGKILQAKKQISPDHGYMALFLDSEGNRLALHSKK